MAQASHNSRYLARKTRPARHNSKYTDAAGKNYGAAQPSRTITVPKTAITSKPATTTTVTRGGFGESVAKRNTMQHSEVGTSTRSMGG